MPTPHISKKGEKLMTITDNAKKLFRAVYAEKNKPVKLDDSVPKIRVSALISKMAFYYEKIRNSVEYKEEHLFRKNAIERIIKRLIIIEGSMTIKKVDSHELTADLLTELIRAGYLPNNSIPETKIEELSRVAAKYLQLKQYSIVATSIGAEEKSRLLKWIISVMASEIEEKLGRSKVDEVIANYMYEILNGKISLPDDSPYLKDKDVQVYIAIHRNFFKFDDDMIANILFKYFNANWQNPDDDLIRKTGENIFNINKAISDQIKHPLSAQMNRVVSRYTVYFSILKDVVSEDPVGIYESFQYDPKAFPRKIKNACNKRYEEARTKLWRSAIRSIIYIFLTKSFFAVLLEVPATKWFGNEINPLSLAINITFPAILLFIIVLFTRMPGDENSAKIVTGINSLIFNEHADNEQYRLREPVKRGTGLNTVFGIIYAVTFFLSFGFVVWALELIQFGWISVIIFLFFLAFVSFFSIRIRKNAKDLMIIEPRENIFTFLVDFFYIPIVEAGKWLSEKFAKINVFVFILDFIIEAPFKIFVEITEEWTKYVKERKDEIV